MSETQVLIAGAGPTGLVLALWLNRLGVTVRVVDKAETAGTTSRALAVQARTLELYRQLGLADEVVARGRKVPAVNLWAKGKHAARLGFEVIGEDLTPYPFLQIFQQDLHEAFLEERLAAAGVQVERRTELVGFEDDGARITARLKGPDGVEETCEAAYIAGCDGARSVVRHVIGAEFPGGTYRQVFYVADTEMTGQAANGELHVDLDEADFLAVFPLPGEGRARLVGVVSDERAEHPETLQFEDVSSRAIHNMKVEVAKVNWFSTYRVHHRVTDRFRRGRAFLAGDAAHIHSPAGGQGMNTGIGDAINLAWKLAWVLRGAAPDTLLDSYEVERMAFARRLVASTDRGFSFASAEGPIADFVRIHVAPLVMGTATKLEAVREFLFRTVSQITLNYRGSPLSAGHVGDVHGGDRLPWSPNQAPTLALDWQARVHGTATPALTGWCAEHGLELCVYPWSAELDGVGLKCDALYLLRPDTYVALIDPAASPQTLARYFDARGLRLAAPAISAA